MSRPRPHLTGSLYRVSESGEAALTFCTWLTSAAPARIGP